MVSVNLKKINLPPNLNRIGGLFRWIEWFDAMMHRPIIDLTKLGKISYQSSVNYCLFTAWQYCL